MSGPEGQAGTKRAQPAGLLRGDEKTSVHIDSLVQIDTFVKYVLLSTINKIKC